MAKITILGSGSWGMALAISAAASGHSVNLWSPFKEEVDLLLNKRTNEKLLKDVFLPEEIGVTDDISVANGSDITVLATPSTVIRSVAQRLAGCKDLGVVVNVSKGLEKESLKRLSEVISEELPEIPVVVLTGPSHAEEVARFVPTTIVAASKNASAAEKVQNIISTNFLRVYTSYDVVGAEIGGALKNVIAIASGFSIGLKLGDNTRAALITRGLAEMARLGVSLGAREYTFAGLTGIGDLIVTCMSQHSRNNRFGQLVGAGTSVEEALEKVGTVEGYYATKMAYELSLKHNIEMPIISECYNVLYGGKCVEEALKDLLARPIKSEH